MVAMAVLLGLAPGAEARKSKRPDLTVPSLRAGATAAPGGSLAASYVIRNAGKGKAKATTVELVLSTDGRRSANDVLLTSKRVGALKPQRKAGGTAVLTIPASAPAGAGFLLACADPQRLVRESNERNNCATPSPLTVTGAGGTPTPTPTATATPTTTPQACNPLTLRVISLPDFRGQLDPVDSPAVGGAAFLATWFATERSGNPNTLVLAGGNSWGAAPPLSELFNHDPTVKALNLMGIDLDTLGSHNFDDGTSELQRLITLSAHGYTVSNLSNMTLTGVTAPYVIKTVGGVKVAIVGVASPTLAQSQPPQNLGGITVGDPITAAQNAHAAAAAAGATVFIADTGLGSTGKDVSNNYVGPLIDFAKGVAGYDAILGALTDQSVATTVNNTTVVQARSAGRQYARVDMPANTCTGRTGPASATLVTPADTVAADPAVVSMLQPYRDQLPAKLDTKLDQTSVQFTRDASSERLGEVPLGDLVADAWRTYTGTQFSLIDGGSLRAGLPSSYTPSAPGPSRPPGPAPWDLLIGDAYAVLPFGNQLITRTVTGAQLWAALENGVSAYPAASGRFPQISGFKFVWSASAPAGARVTSVTFPDNTNIPKDGTTYTITISNFLNAGGVGYSMFNDGAGIERGQDAEALMAYMKANSNLVLPAGGRQLRTP